MGSSWGSLHAAAAQGPFLHVFRPRVQGPQELWRAREWEFGALRCATAQVELRPSTCALETALRQGLATGSASCCVQLGATEVDSEEAPGVQLAAMRMTVVCLKCTRHFRPAPVQRDEHVR